MYKLLKNSILGSVLVVLSNSVIAETSAAPSVPAPSNDDMAYFMGYQFGTALSQQGSGNLDPEIISEAMKQALSGEPSVQTEAMKQAVMTEFQNRARRQQEQALAMIKSQSEDFLTQNALRKEVITTESGLQYEVLVEGSGVSPKVTDQVTVHYEGRLASGEVFDSSLQRGEPATFGLDRVITGWTEGLQLMKVGGHTRFFIPSNLGYGDRGTRTIPPHSALVFDVQLIEVIAETPAN